MRVLLGQGTAYLPSWGGANKSNRLLLEALAERGHACLVVAPIEAESRDAFRAMLDAEGATLRSETEQTVEFTCRGVDVCAVAQRSRLQPAFARAVTEYPATTILVSSEDVGQGLLQAAVRRAAGKVVYLARTTLAFPFGPHAAVPSARGAALLESIAGVVAQTHYVKEYVRQWTGLDAAVLPISLFGSGPFPCHAAFTRGDVTCINPCAVKGISIFLDLARHLPHVSFAAVPSWGACRSDHEQLARLDNISVAPPTSDPDAIWKRTRVLLVPSLWAEAAGRVVIEAMLHGIPVLASDVGGLPEMKLGVDYLLPVEPISQYGPMLDERHLPVPVVPAQPLTPWIDALGTVTHEPEVYMRLSRASRKAALDYVAAATIDPFEEYLRERCAT